MLSSFFLICFSLFHFPVYESWWMCHFFPSLFIWFIETIFEKFSFSFFVALVVAPFPFQCFWLCVQFYLVLYFFSSSFYSVSFHSIPFRSVDTERCVFYTLILFFFFFFVRAVGFHYAHRWWYQSHFHCALLLSLRLSFMILFAEYFHRVHYSYMASK